MSSNDLELGGFSYDEMTDDTTTRALDITQDMTPSELERHHRLLTAFAAPAAYRLELLNRLHDEVVRLATRAGTFERDSLPRIAAMEGSRQALQILMEHDPAAGRQALTEAIAVLEQAVDAELAQSGTFPLLTA